MDEIRREWSLRVGLIVTDRETEPDPDVLLVPAKLDIVPTRIWSRGELISNRGSRLHKVSGFRYDLFRGDDGDPEKEMDLALRWITAYAGAGQLLNYEKELAVTVKLFGRNTPALALSAHDIGRAAASNISIDFDIYVWSD